MRKAAKTIRQHISNIVTYYRHLVTNAMSEGLNSQIQKITSIGPRVPKHRALQDCHLLPRRRARSLPMLNPEAPNYMGHETPVCNRQ
jgi:hypothetical protein